MWVEARTRRVGRHLWRVRLPRKALAMVLQVELLRRELRSLMEGVAGQEARGRGMTASRRQRHSGCLAGEDGFTVGLCRDFLTT